MTDKTIGNTKKVGGDYFGLNYLRSSDKITFMYLDKPLPPIEIIKKIKVL